MRIACIGGGPAGLYLAILMKKADPRHDITVYERNRPDDTYGWGIVFSDATLGNFRAADPESHDEITRRFHHWDNCDIFFKGRRITSGGHGFCGLDRRALLDILQTRAAGLGVRLVFETEIEDETQLADADLIVAADGVHSKVRNKYAAHFQPDIDVRKCRYIWFGTHLKLDAFTFITEPSEWGWFQVHAYQFDRDTSTFIVECREETWRAAGLDQLDQAGSIAFCEKLFARHLQGHRLMTNAHHPRGSDWLNFNRVLCKRWHRGNIVLIGDAAHTAHFSIGSGTKLAMEDAIALSQTLLAHPDDPGQALVRYQTEREAEALRLQSAARNRMEWFENVARYARLAPEQFAYALLTGSQRIGHENLRRRDPAYVASVESWLAGESGLPARPLPPMFTPFTLRGLKLKNRVVVSPMAMYSCRDGVPADFLLAHLGSRALGGAGLVMTEMTGVAPEARITPGCAGLWNEAQAQGWQRIVEFVHAHSDARIGLQLGHAGPKGSTRPGWEASDEPLADGNWPLLAASALAYGPRSQTPRAMTHADMDAVREQFAAAARRGAAAGFDLLELHCAHGYLLSSFLCPLTNQRADAYGGELANRLRYPLEIFAALRAVWPADKPITVRISAHDWAPGGNTPEDAVAIARAFQSAGADMIDVSSGQTTRAARPVYGRMYQTPFSDQIRNEIGIATIAVGNIFEADHVNSIIAAGRADLCAIGRPHLADPAWTLHAAAQLGYSDAAWPKQYLSGKAQLEHNLAHAAEPALRA
ncbi:MAG: bifunctional salicylyl-CoA 5-hydroxylase/oxidoreductase [Zoogloeaceae bacterium]|jgi:anthraniloyl-CoA monooxygenase|nr:bifunctional salicylyl-CoA 5-hydroxylase/oxidoreductase [Zoogloeaceae bacterium]